MYQILVKTKGNLGIEQAFEGFTDPFAEVAGAEECHLTSVEEGLAAFRVSGDVRRCLGMMRSDGHPTGFMRGKGSQALKDSRALAHYVLYEAGIDMSKVVSLKAINLLEEVVEAPEEAPEEEVESDGFGLIGV